DRDRARAPGARHAAPRRASPPARCLADRDHPAARGDNAEAHGLPVLHLAVRRLPRLHRSVRRRASVGESRDGRGAVSRPLIVSWKRYQRRSDVLAERLGADVLWRPHRFVQRVLRPLDYIHHAVQDLVSIRRVQPSVVIVQSPPHIAAIAPWSLRLPLVIDAHNAQLQSWWRGAPGARSLLAAARVVLTHTAE